MTINEKDNYFNDVIQRWDEASGSFLNECREGNQSSKASSLNMLHTDGSIDIKTNLDNTYIKKMRAVKETIDGVGTKIQIYTNQFENTFQSREKQEIDWKTAKIEATELRERMLMDLIAMNADDLRWWELAIGATNIIDINHLKWARGHLFQDSMADAMKKVIRTTGIAMTAGETAVLGMSPEASKIQTVAQKTIEEIQKILNEQIVEWMSSSHNQRIQEIINTFNTSIKIKSEEISFNIWWTCLWLAADGNKLIHLKDGQTIIGFQETAANGIIWPRSNGITKIREDMKTIMGDGRENKTFEAFLAKIWPEKSAKIPEKVKKICMNKKLRDIATGKTTVFNPLIANTLLGGIESDPIVWISALIHVTGNPLKKISEWINKDKKNTYTVNINMSNMPTPQIITLLQAALDIPDEQAMNKRNMWVPYAVICNPDHATIILRKASEENIEAEIIGTVVDETIEKPTGTKSSWFDPSIILEKEKWKNRIIGVGLNKSNISF